MEKREWIILIAVLIFIALLVFIPHYTYRFPLHVDEWHHITQAIKLNQENKINNFAAIEIGFHYFLVLLSMPFNLVFIYRFLPAIWAVFSALVLFYVVKQKTSKLKSNFFISIFAVIFFASIRSNINLTGLWFFTPLTFSIPFIFLYIYLFTEGIEKNSSKMLLTSLIIMIFLVFVHSISVLFSLPFLIIYTLIKIKKSRNQPVLLLFILIPITGFFFYKFVIKKPFLYSLLDLLNKLQFRYGWGVLESNNSPFEIYSLIGYILAIIGLIFIFSSKENKKKFLVYILWPLTLLVSIIIFKITKISLLSPYQRNLYYFAISLPILSALGLNYLINLVKKIKKNKKNKKIIIITVIIIIILLTFCTYTSTGKKYKVYHVIDEKDYESLVFLSNFSASRVMAPSDISTAMFPLTAHEPVATIYFYGNKTIVNNFFKDLKDLSDNNCKFKNEIIKKYKVSYVVSEKEILCNWTEIYNKDKIIIYSTNDISKKDNI